MLFRSLMHLASDVFDEQGFLKQELIHNRFLKGTGCWGPEINTGMIVYINAISVVSNVSTKTPAYLFALTVS